jgi:hypothetical protein
MTLFAAVVDRPDHLVVTSQGLKGTGAGLDHT